ncbi:MAG: hypothetical protein IAI48_01290 [Candidatus Eremiobacteraeota bacterium]|nr:hypothetical protein [Candidatus Eremiobacteraeota bacterium]
MRAESRAHVFDTVFAVIAILLNVLAQLPLDAEKWPAGVTSAVCSGIFIVAVRRTFLAEAGVRTLMFFVFIEALVFTLLVVNYTWPGFAPRRPSEATWPDVVFFPWSTTAIVLVFVALRLRDMTTSVRQKLWVESAKVISAGLAGTFVAGVLAVLGLGGFLMPVVAHARLNRASTLIQPREPAANLCSRFPFDEGATCRPPAGIDLITNQKMVLSFVSFAMFCVSGETDLVVSFDAEANENGWWKESGGDGC